MCLKKEYSLLSNPGDEDERLNTNIISSFLCSYLPVFFSSSSRILFLTVENIKSMSYEIISIFFYSSYHTLGVHIDQMA